MSKNLDGGQPQGCIALGTIIVALERITVALGRFRSWGSFSGLLALLLRFPIAATLTKMDKLLIGSAVEVVPAVLA